MRTYTPFHAIIAAAIVLAGCQNPQSQKRSDWDHYDYQKISRERAPQDNDAYYIPPVNPGCLDDSPGNSSYCQ